MRNLNNPMAMQHINNRPGGSFSNDKEKEMSKNKPKYVLFDPVAVGWHEGLTGAMKDAKTFKVPLAVRSDAVKAEIKRRHPDLYTIVIIPSDED